MPKPWLGHRMTYADPVCQAEVDQLRTRIIAALELHYPVLDRGLQQDVCARCKTIWPCRTTEALSVDPQ